VARGQERIVVMQGLVELPDSRRERAVRADETSVTGLSLADLWVETTRGQYKILDSFFSRTRCISLLAPQRSAGPPLDARLLDTFEGALLGGAQKCVAAELSVSPSTVATRCKEAMYYLGVESTCSRVPLLLAVLVHSARGNNGPHVGRSSRCSTGGGDVLVVSFPRPDLRLRERLSPTECEIASLCMEGHSLERMAAIQGTSRRTIANQLGSVYRKLRLSGRGEFLAWLAAESGRMSVQARELLLLGVSRAQGCASHTNDESGAAPPMQTSCSPRPFRM
jgi:DNA-binding CsgD family transcriptional regulator